MKKTRENNTQREKKISRKKNLPLASKQIGNQKVMSGQTVQARAGGARGGEGGWINTQEERRRGRGGGGVLRETKAVTVMMPAPLLDPPFQDRNREFEQISSRGVWQCTLRVIAPTIGQNHSHDLYRSCQALCGSVGYVFEWCAEQLTYHP